MLTTDQKGAIAEAAVAFAAIKLGIGVYKPVMEGGRYDLILEVGNVLLRTQCKWAPRHRDVVVIRCYRCRRAREGLRKRGYAADEIDAIVAYCQDLDRCFFLPAERVDGHMQLQLRLSPSRNNQGVGINWADNFDFEASLRALSGP